MKLPVPIVIVALACHSTVLTVGRVQAQSRDWKYEQYNPSPADRPVKERGQPLAEVNAVVNDADKVALSKGVRNEGSALGNDLGTSSTQHVQKPEIVNPNPGPSSNAARGFNAYATIASPDERNASPFPTDEHVKERMMKLSVEKAKLAKMLNSRGVSQEEVMAQMQIVNEQVVGLNESRLKQIFEQRKRKQLQQAALQRKIAERRIQTQSNAQAKTVENHGRSDLLEEDSFLSGK